jgi:hypothetical protein
MKLSPRKKNSLLFCIKKENIFALSLPRAYHGLF